MKDKIKIKIEDTEFEAEKRTFSSGNTGFGLYKKIMIEGQQHQISCNIIKLK